MKILLDLGSELNYHNFMDHIKTFNIPKVETDAPKAIEYAFPPNISVAASLNGATLPAKSSGDIIPNNEMQQKKVEK